MHDSSVNSVGLLSFLLTCFCLPELSGENLPNVLAGACAAGFPSCVVDGMFTFIDCAPLTCALKKCIMII